MQMQRWTVMLLDDRKNPIRQAILSHDDDMDSIIDAWLNGIMPGQVIEWTDATTGETTTIDVNDPRDRKNG